MSVYLPLDEKLNVSHIEEMFLKNKYFEKLCCEELKTTAKIFFDWKVDNMTRLMPKKCLFEISQMFKEDIDLDDISSYAVGLDRKIIEELWDISLEDRYEARDYIIDNWDNSRYTNRNKD